MLLGMVVLAAVNSGGLYWRLAVIWQDEDSPGVDGTGLCDFCDLVQVTDHLVLAAAQYMFPAYFCC